ncbi:hypothetical protein [Sphingomonas gilva]|uniref:hypothetical protein n=1 Tax=Sphingomonas gilva TaxID=2305907 RepID=UPI001CA3D1F1|nr:hypothetical protein [Sphingomonas gilva]
MAERTALITAGRESEDNLIKTIIQLASALVALMAGFITQKQLDFSIQGFLIFSVSISFFVISIIAALTEQFFSAQAYRQQLKLLEDYYGKVTDSFSEPAANKWVRKAKVTAFACFLIAILTLAILAVLQARGVNDGKRPPATPTTTTTPTAATAATAPAPTPTSSPAR